MSDPTFSQAAASPRRWWEAGAVVLVAWALILHPVSLEWLVNPQYGYGWGVPWLALYLAWKRWPGRPAPGPPLPGGLALAAVWVALWLWVPVRLCVEANPEWRQATGLSVALGCLGTLGLIGQAGGLPWVRWFSLPVLFTLLAIPWPMRLEKYFVQGLLRGITGATAELMNWLGVAAVQHGNLIELTNGVVGVNEACSGIRSFQSTIMVAVFAATLFRLPAGWWVVLPVAGGVWAVALNLARTTLLTWLCATRGQAAQAAWHDPAGYAVYALSLAGIWGAAVWLGRHRGRPEKPGSAAGPLPRLIPRWQLGLMLVHLLALEGLTEAWYRRHERGMTAGTGWKVAWPAAAAGFERRRLEQDVLVILRCDRGESGVWRRPDGSRWTLFFIGWKGGRMAASLAQGHTPDVCLPATGFRMISEAEPTRLQVGGLVLPFRTFVFEGNGRPWHVFFCLVEDRPPPAGTAQLSGAKYLAGLDPKQRWRAVWEGRRHHGQQVLEIAMDGYATLEQAQRALAEALPGLIRIQTSP